jgi:hypothetical protein
LLLSFPVHLYKLYKTIDFLTRVGADLRSVPGKNYSRGGTEGTDYDTLNPRQQSAIRNLQSAFRIPVHSSFNPCSGIFSG